MPAKPHIALEEVPLPRQAPRKPWPALLVFLLTNAGTGALVGVALAAALVSTNAGGLRTLVMSTGEPLIPAVLLAVGFASLIGGLWAAAAVMLMPYPDKDEDR